MIPPRESSLPTAILVIEDDDDVRKILERGLTREGYEVRSATSGENGLSVALESIPDLLIVDVELPNGDGVYVTRELRKRGFNAPVLMLTARSSLSDKVAGLDAGADDYLPKPFEYPELLARVKALLRRSSLASAERLLHVGDITLDPLARRVDRAGAAVKLTQKEYALLEFLMRNAGRTLSRQAIAKAVWKEPIDEHTNIVDVYVAYLRKKLGDDKEGGTIRTVRGEGYIMTGDR